MPERYLSARDYTPARSWELCEWCHARGADEFTLNLIGTAPAGDKAWDALDGPIAPFARAPGVREHLSARTKAEFHREAPLWALTDKSRAALPRLFPRGPFEYSIADPAWCEDLILYREGELMFGTLSSDDAGLVRLTELELAQFSAAGFRSHEKWPRG